MTMPDPTHPEVGTRPPADTAAGVAAREVDATFAALHQLLDDLRADAERLKREINGDEGVLRWLNIDLADPFNERGGDDGNPVLIWLIDKCIAGLTYAGQQLAEVYAKISPFFTYVGNPELIRRHKDAWIEQVGGPVSERAGWFTPNKTLIDDSWTGAASSAYGNTLPAQKEAASAVADSAMKIAASLEGLADGISQFWADLAATIREAAKSMVIISVGLLSMDAGETATKIISELFSGAEEILKALQDASEKYRHTVTQLSTQLNLNTAFPSAKWPTPGEPISINISDWTPGATE
jgi:hypothetical protein